MQASPSVGDLISCTLNQLQRRTIPFAYSRIRCEHVSTLLLLLLLLPSLSSLLLSPPFPRVTSLHFTSIPATILRKSRPKRNQSLTHFDGDLHHQNLKPRTNSANFKTLPHRKNPNSLTQPSPYKGSRSNIQ